jgi:catalase
MLWSFAHVHDWQHWYHAVVANLSDQCMLPNQSRIEKHRWPGGPYQFLGSSVLQPEATQMFTRAMSDSRIQWNFRMMQAFGINTFGLIKKDRISDSVKFHFTTSLSVNSFACDEGLKISKQNLDFHLKDLYEIMNGGVHPKWNFDI